MIELSKLTVSRKSFVEIEVADENGEMVTEKLNFEYKPITPLLLRELDKISAETKKHNEKGEKDAEKDEKETDFVSRSALLEQLCILLTKLDITENGNLVSITVSSLEKINLSILTAINLKIYEERTPTKKNLTTLNAGSSEDSASLLVG